MSLASWLQAPHCERRRVIALLLHPTLSVKKNSEDLECPHSGYFLYIPAVPWQQKFMCLRFSAQCGTMKKNPYGTFHRIDRFTIKSSPFLAQTKDGWAEEGVLEM